MEVGFDMTGWIKGVIVVWYPELENCVLLGVLPALLSFLEGDWVLLPYGGLVNSWLKRGHMEVKQRSKGGFIHGFDSHYLSHPMPSV